MAKVTSKDVELIRGVELDLEGAFDGEYAGRLFFRVAARAPESKAAWLACEIAAAFIRLSEDLKEQLASRGEAAPQRTPDLEARLSAAESRINVLEKELSTTSYDVADCLKRICKLSPSCDETGHPVSVGDVVYDKEVVEAVWVSKDGKRVPAYRLDGEDEFRYI